MHDTAMAHGAAFFSIYTRVKERLTIVDIGAQDVNGSLRSVAPRHHSYIGVDFEAAKGVDIVISDPYSLPFETGSVDVVVSSSCFEHSEFFWLLFNEALRILKPTGLLYINAPSNGPFHQFPVDCWRFYTDSGVALQNWARKSGYNAALLESFVGLKKADVWNDFVAVFLRDEKNIHLHPNRILNHTKQYAAGRVYGSDVLRN